MYLKIKNYFFNQFFLIIGPVEFTLKIIRLKCIKPKVTKLTSNRIKITLLCLVYIFLLKLNLYTKNVTSSKLTQFKLNSKTTLFESLTKIIITYVSPKV